MTSFLLSLDQQASIQTDDTYFISLNTTWHFNIVPPRLSSASTYKFRVVAMNLYGESPHSIPSKPYQVPQASPRMADRPVVGPHISSTDAISDTQIMLRWTVSTVNAG